eukprot:169387_1
MNQNKQNKKHSKLYLQNVSSSALNYASYANAVASVLRDTDDKLEQKPLVDNTSHNSDNTHIHSKLSFSQQKNIRIIQRNYAFIHGLSNEFCNINTLTSWFGQFGNIKDIIIYDTAISIHENRRFATIIYFDNCSAKHAIDWINNKSSFENNRILKAMYGYERYCTKWLQTHKCTAINCRSVHSWCKDTDILTEEMHIQFNMKKSGKKMSHNLFSNIQKENKDNEMNGNNIYNCEQQHVNSNKQLNPMAAPFPNNEMQQTSADMILLMQNVNAQQLILQQQQTIMQLNQQLLHTQNQLQMVTQNYNVLEGKYEELELKYCNLDDKCCELEKIKNDIDVYGHTKDKYDMWDSKDVYDWIVSVYNGRFKKYEMMLYTNIKKENIIGNCLPKLDIRDIDRIGITEFKDKIALMVKINELIGNSGIQNSNEGNPSIL